MSPCQCNLGLAKWTTQSKILNGSACRVFPATISLPLRSPDILLCTWCHFPTKPCIIHLYCFWCFLLWGEGEPRDVPALCSKSTYALQQSPPETFCFPFNPPFYSLLLPLPPHTLPRGSEARQMWEPVYSCERELMKYQSALSSSKVTFSLCYCCFPNTVMLPATKDCD